MNQHNDKSLNYQPANNFSQNHQMKQLNDKPLSFIKKLTKHIERVEGEYLRIKFYKKHKHLWQYIEDLEIFTANRFKIVVRACGEKTSRETVSALFFYLHLDKLLGLTLIPTNIGTIAQLYFVDTIDPEKKTEAIEYYKNINPKGKSKHDKEKNQDIRTYMRTRKKHRIQTIAHTDEREAIAAEAKQKAKGRDQPKVKEIQEYKKKSGYAETKRRAQLKKKQKATSTNSKKATIISNEK